MIVVAPAEEEYIQNEQFNPCQCISFFWPCPIAGAGVPIGWFGHGKFQIFIRHCFPNIYFSIANEDTRPIDAVIGLFDRFFCGRNV